MSGFFSKLDDFVNDEIPGGWYTVAALGAGGAGYGMGGSGATGGGFSWLPSGEMTVADGAEVIGGSGGSSNFLSGLFGGNSELAPLNPTDYSRAVEMYPTSSGNIFEPSGMSPSQISSIQGAGDSALMQNQLANKLKPKMPDFGGQAQQQVAQQLAQLNQGGESGGIKRGQAIPQAILSSLLDPKVALKAYRPTLL